MREEVSKDARKALIELKEVTTKKRKSLKTQYPADLSLLKRWNRFHTTEKLIEFYPRHRDIQRVILTSLTLKYAKRSKTENEELAYMHAIMREMGGWFNRISEFKYPKESEYSYSYRYVFSSSYFANNLFLWPFTLIVRYTFISSKFQTSKVHGQLEYNYTGYQPTNLIDGFYYTTAFPNGGCPRIIAKHRGGK